jgi:DNA-binding XRE family transcriptional regulator
LTYKESPLHNFFRSRLKQLRHEKNFTQKQVGEAVGLSPITVSGWEIGKSMPETVLLPELADCFETSIDNLLGHSTPPAPRSEMENGVAFVPVFGCLAFLGGRLQCLDYLGRCPVPDEMQALAGPDGLLCVAAPGSAVADAGLTAGDLVALLVGVPFEDGELCGVILDNQPFRLLRVQRLPNGYRLQTADPNHPGEVFVGDTAAAVHVIGPYAGIWHTSPRMQKKPALAPPLDGPTTGK